MLNIPSARERKQSGNFCEERFLRKRHKKCIFFKCFGEKSHPIQTFEKS